MPKGSSIERLENIRAHGATADITDLNYDDTVRLAGATAEENGWVFVQDTSWPDYEKIPGWIMEGYTTMGHEITGQLGGERPTHLLLQAGVGAMAGAMTAYFKDYYGDDAPIVIIVEPDQADCIYRTARADDGSIHAVKGSLSTIMAGLACGEPCTIGWDVLHAHADHFLSVPDGIAAKGMRILGNPLPGDPAVISGESGAVTLGVAAELMQNESLLPLRKALNLDENAKILCISTEGDTDKAYYRKIVWDGLCPQ
jgi:diaminopropionate ammonia-lyase